MKMEEYSNPSFNIPSNWSLELEMPKVRLLADAERRHTAVAWLSNHFRMVLAHTSEISRRQRRLIELCYEAGKK